MKNLILGAAKGYGWDLLEPFVTSCKMNCPDAELVLFVDEMSEFTRDRLINAGVQLEKFPDQYKDALIIHVRWKTYADFLDRHGDEYETVFVTDTRDVIFQGDIFAVFNDCKNWLGFATECYNLRREIPNGGANYRWLVGRFGKAEADKLADKKIICCGTVIASLAEMKIFCREMWNSLKAETVWGHEQAVMNYLVYNRLLPIENLIELDVDCGEIFTNGLIKKNKIRGDKILRGDGSVPEVVHQYDRHKNLIKLVDKLYRDKNFSADERFTDPRSMLEQVICLLNVDKLNDAARFFTAKILDGANFDGNIDTLLKIWLRAFNRPLSPAVGYLELSAQNALLTVQNFSLDHLKKFCSFLNQATKTKRVVDYRLKLLVAEALCNIAEQTVRANAAEICFECIDLINSLDMVPDKNFYLFEAKANRIFGRKDAALAAYQKVLELD